MKLIEMFREEEPGGSLPFHLEGVLDAASNVRRHIKKLGTVYGVDDERTLEILAHLEVELYSHLLHHLRGLRNPLEELLEKVAERLPEEDSDETDVTDEGTS